MYGDGGVLLLLHLVLEPICRMWYLNNADGNDVGPPRVVEQGRLFNRVPLICGSALPLSTLHFVADRYVDVFCLRNVRVEIAFRLLRPFSLRNGLNMVLFRHRGRYFTLFPDRHKDLALWHVRRSNYLCLRIVMVQRLRGRVNGTRAMRLPITARPARRDRVAINRGVREAVLPAHRPVMVILNCRRLIAP